MVELNIFMTRDNYEKFLTESGNVNCRIGKYSNVVIPNMDNAFRPFIKVEDTRTIVKESRLRKKYLTGIWVDVFPIDYAYDDSIKNEEYIMTQKKNISHLIISCSFISKNPFKTPLKIAYNIFNNLIGRNTRYWIKKTRLLPEVKCSNFAGTIIWPVGVKDAYPVDFFDGYTKLYFEDNEYMCFKRYDDILRWRFGNYMQLPPENERRHHEIEAYWL